MIPTDLKRRGGEGRYQKETPMKAISKAAQKTLEVLIEKMVNGYAKIDTTNGTFMPVVVERLSENEVMVGHYFEDHGEFGTRLTTDIEMIFHLAHDGSYYATEITNGFIKKQILVVWNEDGSFRFSPRAQREAATFTTMWMRNIKQQQDLKKA